LASFSFTKEKVALKVQKLVRKNFNFFVITDLPSIIVHNRCCTTLPGTSRARTTVSDSWRVHCCKAPRRSEAEAEWEYDAGLVLRYVFILVDISFFYGI